MFVPEAYGGRRCPMPLIWPASREISQAPARRPASSGRPISTRMKPLIDFGHRGAEGSACCRGSPKARIGALASPSRSRLRRHRHEDPFRPDGDEIVVSGGKTFISNGDVADLYLLFGKWAAIDDRREGTHLGVYIEKGTPGLSVLRTRTSWAPRRLDTATLAFEDCRVPRDNLLGAPGEGLRLLLAALNKSRPSVAAHALGIARAAFEDAVAYINERRQSGRSIVEFQGIQFLLADLADRTGDVRELAVARGGADRRRRADIGIEASMLKLRAIAIWRCASPPRRCSCTAATATSRNIGSSGCCATPRSRRSGKAPTRSTAS